MARTWALLIAVTAAVAAALVMAGAGYDRRALAGQRVLVCGASMGIGAEVALNYARGGARVALAARSEGRLRAVAAAAAAAGAAEVAVLVADFGTVAGAEAAVAGAVAAFGGLDVVVLNHIAAMPVGPLSEAPSPPSEVLPRLFAVNMFSYVYIAAAAMPSLVASRGALCVVSSIAGLTGVPLVAPYAATKHALVGYFESWRAELASERSPVSVTIAVLGNIDTEGAANNTRGRTARIEAHPAAEAAEAIVRGTALRLRDAYYPYADVAFARFAYWAAPSALDAVTRWALSLP